MALNISYILPFSLVKNMKFWVKKGQIIKRLFFPFIMIPLFYDFCPKSSNFVSLNCLKKLQFSIFPTTHLKASLQLGIKRVVSSINSNFRMAGIKMSVLAMVLVIISSMEVLLHIKCRYPRVCAQT